MVAKDDRRLRIEVGYGLEGAIPDSVAKRVIEERITPRFREGDFSGGIRDGVDQLIRLAEGEKLPPPRPARGRRRMRDAGRFSTCNPVHLDLRILFLRHRRRESSGRCWAALPGSLDQQRAARAHAMVSCSASSSPLSRR